MSVYECQCMRSAGHSGHPVQSIPASGPIRLFQSDTPEGHTGRDETYAVIKHQVAEFGNPSWDAPSDSSPDMLTEKRRRCLKRGKRSLNRSIGEALDVAGKEGRKGARWYTLRAQAIETYKEYIEGKIRLEKAKAKRKAATDRDQEIAALRRVHSARAHCRKARRGCQVGVKITKISMLEHEKACVQLRAAKMRVSSESASLRILRHENPKGMRDFNEKMQKQLPGYILSGHETEYFLGDKERNESGESEDWSDFGDGDSRPGGSGTSAEIEAHQAGSFLRYPCCGDPPTIGCRGACRTCAVAPAKD